METKAHDSKPTTRDVWFRGLFMLLFMIGFSGGTWLLNLLVIVQFVWLLLAREPNQFIASFGSSLSSGSRTSGASSRAPRKTNHFHGQLGPSPRGLLKSLRPDPTTPQEPRREAAWTRQGSSAPDNKLSSLRRAVDPSTSGRALIE